MDLVPWTINHFELTLPERCSYDREDLIQAGRIGLIKAAQKYNPDKGKFSTYAVLWIRQACSRFICDEAYLISISRRSKELRSKVYAGMLKNENNKEIADYLDVPVDEVKKVQAEMSMSSAPIYINGVLEDEKNEIDGYFNFATEDCANEVIKKETLKDFIENHFSVKNKEILKLILSGYTHRQIAERRGCCYQNVNVVFQKALKRADEYNRGYF